MEKFFTSEEKSLIGFSTGDILFSRFWRNFLMLDNKVKSDTFHLVIP